MEIKISIADEMVASFSSGAKEALHEQMTKYAHHIIKEAHLLEEDARVDGAKNEITSNTIITATQRRKSNPITKKTQWFIWIKLASTFSLLFTGIFFGVYGMQPSVILLLLSALCLVCACVTTVYVYIKEQVE